MISNQPYIHAGDGITFLVFSICSTFFFFRESKKSLLEEGNIMASLKHERVVKLLGVIMEDKDCSLVMELLPRGNLLVMLQTVSRSTDFSCL